MHYAYYKIQDNPSLVAPNERQELFYVRWLKEKIPALKDFGVKVSLTLYFLEIIRESWGIFYLCI